MLVATHNIMFGLAIPGAIAHYAGLRRTHGLDVLCLQENLRAAAGPLSELVARELGEQWQVVQDPRFLGCATLYDSERLRLVDHHLVRLPYPAQVPAFERLFLVGGLFRRWALLCRFVPAQGASAPVLVANFHLDACGGNAHRRAQLQATVDAMLALKHSARIVACGDTNALGLNPKRPAAPLRDVLPPLQALGVEDPGVEPTHWFARCREPFPMHQLCRRVARLGLELPLRYDIVATDLPVQARGQLHTPESDHDLVWTRVAAWPPPVAE